MPQLSLSYNLIIAEDQTDKSPKRKLPDLEISVSGIQVMNDASSRHVLSPGEERDIIITSRATGIAPSTQLAWTRPVATLDKARLSWTGTGPAAAFRTDRLIGGDATTVVSITRRSPYVIRVQSTSGTAFNMINVTPGDSLRIEPTIDAQVCPFSPINQRTLPVQSKGSNYVDVVDNGQCAEETVTLGDTASKFISVMSAQGVKIGDILQTSLVFNPSNTGRYCVTDVASGYIEIQNPYCVEEVVLASTGVNVFEYLIGFMNLRSTGPIEVQFGDQTSWTLIEKIGWEAMLMASISTFKVSARNSGQNDAEISVQVARVIG